MAYKILVVDDEPDVVNTLAPRLLREGYEVVAAFDGEEALVKIKDDNPDIVLLDLMIPKRNGFEVLKELRQINTDKWRPVIIISAKGDLESLKQGYNLEADLYLTKPCSIEHILHGVKVIASLIPHRSK